MDDFKEQGPWDEDEVQMEDLRAPEQWFSFFLFSIGKKWQGATRFQSTPVALGCIACLIALLLLPGSTRVSSVPHAPRSAAPFSQPANTCFAHSIDATVITRQQSSAVPAPFDGSVHTWYECRNVPLGAGKP